MQPNNAQMAQLTLGFMDRATSTGIKEHEAYSACLRWLHEFTKETPPVQEEVKADNKRENKSNGE